MGCLATNTSMPVFTRVRFSMKWSSVLALLSRIYFSWEDIYNFLGDISVRSINISVRKIYFIWEEISQ